MPVPVLSRQSALFGIFIRSTARLTYRQCHSSALPNPMTLRSRSATVYLLGTMHIAEASATAARDLIRREHAKGTLGAVFLELDEARHARLTRSLSGNPDDSLLSHALSTLHRIPNAPLAALVEFALIAVYRSLHQLGFASGVEFQAAIETASRLGVPLILGDQHIMATTGRLAEACRADLDLPRLLSLALADSLREVPETPIEKTVREAFQAIAAGDVARGQELMATLLDRAAIQEIVKPMRRYVPKVTNALLKERDLVMVDNLIDGIAKLPDTKHNVVAVVGLAHVDGISREWEKRMGGVEIASERAPS